MFTKNNLIERIHLLKHDDHTTRYSIHKKNLGSITIVILVVMTILLWIAFPPPPYPDNNWVAITRANTLGKLSAH